MEKCAKHSADIKYIILEQNSVKLACIECRDEKLEQGLQLEKCILIQKVLKLPEVLLSKIDIDMPFKNFFSNIVKITNEDLNNFKQQWIKQMSDIKDSIEKLINETNNYFEILSNLLSSYRIELKKIIKFEVFEQYIQANINNENFNQQTSAIIQQTRHEINTQIELKIQEYINQMIKGNNDEIKKNIEDQIKDYKNKVINLKIPSSKEILDQLKSGIEGFQKAIAEKSHQVNPFYIKCSNLLTNANFQDILFRIKQQQNPNNQIIYQGSKDGFQTTTFWNKIQNKSNLLMIMKTKNSQCTFGGYSPCQWIKSPQPQFMSDDQAISFLFIQSPNLQLQIYPIKNDCKHEAIFVNQNLGPQFGKNDLQLFAEFKEGYINIGQHYSRDPRENLQTFILGPKLTEIMECEIFQL
ncbi:unnamed protein product [Paramecium primaurelia]|uniref:TLDc domain-containing protein n=1 Tax=Paramecium primaurelia TaxID=5886 RepID=A0A8S1PKJ9_PARPR|nr:unnamed protein product [Paramecium primaurelia]